MTQQISNFDRLNWVARMRSLLEGIWLHKLDPVTLTLIYQCHKAKLKWYYLRSLLDPFISDVQHLRV